jgi:hypothetical protein
VLEDGQGYIVQYFERVRLEYHPENAAPNDVLLRQFGRRALRAGDVVIGALYSDSVPAQPGATYFPQTGHNVGGRFLTTGGRTAAWRNSATR